MNLGMIFLTFFKIGLFTIGGGLASLPLLKEAVVDGGLISSAEFIDMVAISQSTPGPIGINMATYAGFKLASVLGGVVATLGIVMPSLIIIILIAALMRDFAAHSGVQHTLGGIRPAALGLIASAVWFIFREAVFIADTAADAGAAASVFDRIDIAGLVILAVILTAYSIKKASPIIYILIGAIAGIVFL